MKTEEILTQFTDNKPKVYSHDQVIKAMRLIIEKDRERVTKHLDVTLDYPTIAIEILEAIPITLD